MAEGPGPRPRRGHPLLDLAAAAAAGAAVIAAEFACVRIAAPWFGQSDHVWANALGVVLLALALGYAVGGRAADRDPAGRSLPWLLVGAAAWLALASRLGAPLAAWLAPAEIGADRPLPLSFWGSLASTTALVGPPVALLGALVPILVRRAAPAWGVGLAAGWMGAAGTLGSLLACAAVPLWAIPTLGSRGALAAAGAWLAAVALVLAYRPTAAPAPEPAPDGPSGGGTPSEGGVAPPTAAATASAFAVGLAVTVVEFAAARFLAPRFGASNPVWAGIVATILAALALGNALGGRWAVTLHGASRRGAVALVAAGAWLVFATAAGSWLWVLAPTMEGGAAVPTLHTWGAWTAAAGLFGPPILLLGTASPAFVREVARGRSSGRACGLVFAAGTLGSIAGCYLTPLLLLPWLGTRATLWATAALAALAAVPWFRRRHAAGVPLAAPAPREVEGAARWTGGRRWPCVVGGGVALAGSLLACLLPEGPLRTDPGQVVEVETSYATVRVVETAERTPVPGRFPLGEDTADVRTRFLRFDEDTVSYQSVRLVEDEPRLLTAGRYYDHLALGAWLEGMPWTRGSGDPRVLIVGYCGGTLHRVLSLVAPEGREGPRVVGVELDPAVVRLARERLGPFPSRLDLVAGEDGRAVVEALPRNAPFDLILVDAYQRTQYVPFQLATAEFFASCGARLAPTGAIGVNVNAPSGIHGALLDAIAAAMQAGLGEEGRVWLVPNAQYESNVAVWGTRGRRAPRVAPGAPESLRTAAFTLDRLLVRWVGPARLLLTDDRAPVERLADEALLPVESR